MNEITMNPIGFINSPYKSPEEVPKQRDLRENTEASIELDEKYTDGLLDLDGFSHAIILFYFHKTDQVHLKGKPSFERDLHGIFAIRSPHRPNHIGMTVVKISKIKGNKLYFKRPDMINNTPVLDIKPYIRDSDSKSNVKCGWLEEHLKNREIN